MPQPFIRPYDPSRDLEACVQIFYATLHRGVNFEPAGTLGSYLWCRSYLLLSPETCFVLDDGTAERHAVGYIIGTVDTNAFARKWKADFLPAVETDADGIPIGDSKATASSSEVVTNLTEQEKETLGWMKQSLQNAECSMLQPFPSLLLRFPAHLHVDILPDYQNHGWGTRLMNTALSKMRELGAKGVHLGMVRDNHGARRFYERLGWKLCEEVLDGGKSGEVGREGDAICLVRAL